MCKDPLVRQKMASKSCIRYLLDRDYWQKTIFMGEEPGFSFGCEVLGVLLQHSKERY